MTKLRLFKCIGRNDGLVHISHRRYFRYEEVYTPVCEGWPIITLVDRTRMAKVNHRSVITCLDCLQRKIAYDACQVPWP